MKNKHGFTMAELLIGMGIFAIIIVILSQVFGGIMALKLKGDSVSSVAGDSRYLLTRLAYDIARSSSLVVSDPSTLILIVDGHTYTYLSQNNLLTLSYDAGTRERLHSPSTRVNQLVFTQLADLGGQQNVNLNLTLESTIIQSGGVIDSRNLISTFATR